jgi:hypothetical protein
MNKYILMASVVFSSLFAQEERLTLPFEKAHQNKMIRFEAERCSDGITLELTNKTQRPMHLSFAAGLTFLPDDTLVQPRVLVHPRLVALRAGEKRTVVLQAVCGNAPKNASSSHSKTTFSRYKDATTPLKDMLSFLVQREWADLVDVQHVVWVFTNAFNVAGAIHSSLPPEGEKEFIDKLCALIGKKEPGYRMKYEEQDDPNGPAFLAKAQWITSKIEYTLHAPAEVHLVIQNAQQDLVRTCMTLPQQSPGTYRFPFKIDLNDMPAGDYSVCLLGNGKVLQTLPFTI